MATGIKASELERIVNDVNRKYLDKLCGESTDHKAGDNPVASRTVAPSVHQKCGEKGCFGGFSSSHCFCAKTNHVYHSGTDLEEVIILENPESNPPNKGKVAVGAAIDTTTKPNGEDKDLPVVLAVGINYGQMGAVNYLDGNVPLWDSTGMRQKLDNAIALIESKTEKSCVHPESPKPLEYHLVATNFFPWITQDTWSSYAFNSIEEMLLIGCHGFCDPFAHIERICQKLGNKLQGLVFHGANNAVPYLGSEFLRTRGLSEWKQARPDIVFCDNLSGFQNITNAVRLCGRSLQADDALKADDFDN